MILFAIIGCNDSPPVSCGVGEHWDGQACVPEACGKSTWWEDDSAEALHVSPGGTGDGSSEDPFGSVQEAVDQAAVLELTRVLIAGGLYAENVHLRRAQAGLSLVGRCSALAILDGDTGTVDEAVVTVDLHNSGLVVAMEGLTLQGGSAGGLRVGSGRVEGANLSIRNATSCGLCLTDTGASASINGLSVRSTRAADPSADSAAIQVIRSTELEVHSCELVDNREFGLYADGRDARAVLSDCTVQGTVPREDGYAGWGVFASGGATVEVQDGEIRDNTSVGVLAYESGTSVHISGARIGPSNRGPEDIDAGVVVQDGAEVTADSAEFVGNFDAGVACDDAFLQIWDSTFDGIGGGNSGAVWATHGCQFDMTGGAIQDGVGMGVYASSGANVVISGLSIESLRWAGSGYPVGAIHAESAGTTVDAEDLLVTRNEYAALTVASGATLSLAGSRVEATISALSTGEGGTGAYVSEGTLLIEDSVFEANQRFGVHAREGSTVEVRDTDILNTQPEETGIGGRGLSIYGGSTAIVANCLISGSHELGITAAGAGTSVQLTGVEVSYTSVTSQMASAAGVDVEDSAVLTATDLWSHHNDGPGVYAGNGEFVGANCTFSENGFAGAVTWGGHLSLTDSSIQDNAADIAGAGGLGVFAAGLDEYPASLLLQDVEVRNHRYAAVWLVGPGSYQLMRGSLAASEGVEIRDGYWIHGNGIYASDGIGRWSGASGLLVDGVLIEGNAGTGILLEASTATLTGVVLDDNGRELWQQNCDGVDGVAVDGSEHSPWPCSEVNEVTAPLSFDVYLQDAGQLDL